MRQPEPKPSLGPLLFRAARLLNEEAVARIESEARVGLRPSHTALLPHIDPEAGTRLTELADAMGITKQAVGQLVEDLERMGVVTRVADPLDGRAKLVQITRLGRSALRHGQGVLRLLEAEIAKGIGPERVSALRELLQAVLLVLDGWEAKRHP